jgi:hypothetical protein
MGADRRTLICEKFWTRQGIGVEEKPEGLSTRTPERRMQLRYAVDDRATLQLLNHGLSVVGEIVDLGLGGCRLRVPRESRVRSMARVEVTFKVNGIAFRLSGVTQWTDGSQIVGIRFGEMASRRRDQLAELLAEIEAEAAAKAAKAEADKLAAEKLDAEKRATQQSRADRDRAEREERERLIAEKQSQAKLTQEKLAEEREARRKLAEHTGATRAGMQAPLISPVEPRRPTAPIVPSAVTKIAADTPMEVENQGRPSLTAQSAHPAKQERRAQARHSVDSRATIFLVDVVSRAAGRIIDVSLGGCRIRTAERFPVGIYRRVEVEFVLDGLPFRLGGVTQSLHDRQTVGVRFLDLSERKREQLKMLVEEMDQMHEEKDARGNGGEG